MCTDTAAADIVLTASPTSPALARSFARDAGCQSYALTVLDDAVLLVSELVTNAVLHGGPPIVLQVECDGGRLRVSVRDGSDRLPAPRDAADTAENGRGLGLVDLLTDRWGVETVRDAHGQGKAVWFELAG